MSGTNNDAQPTNQSTSPATPPADDAGKPDEVDYKAKYQEALSHSREWEKRAKSNKDAADELQQLKEAQKTEEQKRAERIATLEKENAAFKLREDQAKWAADASETTGVPANLLRGATQEEIEAHAEALKPHFAKSESEDDQTDNPGADPNAAHAAAFGKTPAGTPASTPALIAAAEKAGDHDLVASLKASMLGTTN